MQTLKEAMEVGWLQLTHWGLPTEPLIGSPFGTLRKYLDDHAAKLIGAGIDAEVRSNDKREVALWRKL